MKHPADDSAPLPPPDPSPEDLARVRELFDRTRAFLEECRKDPRHALEGEDPAALLGALHGSLAARSSPAPAGEDAPAESGAIHQLRPRRSA